MSNFSSLTYIERSRFAYAAGNTELAEALEECAELEAENERLTDRVWDLEQEVAELEAENEEMENELRERAV